MCEVGLERGARAGWVRGEHRVRSDVQGRPRTRREGWTGISCDGQTEGRPGSGYKAGVGSGQAQGTRRVWGQARLPTLERAQSSDSVDIVIIPFGVTRCCSPQCDDELMRSWLCDTAAAAAASTSSPVITAAAYAATMKGCVSVRPVMASWTHPARLACLPDTMSFTATVAPRHSA